MTDQIVERIRQLIIEKAPHCEDELSHYHIEVNLTQMSLVTLTRPYYILWKMAYDAIAETAYELGFDTVILLNPGERQDRLIFNPTTIINYENNNPQTP